MRFDKNRASFLSKVSAALLTLALAVPACTPALAADLTHSPTATGVVRSAHTQDVLAPFSGTLLPFDWETGDAVHAGDVLLEMDTTPVYAPFSGTLSVLFAAAGDDAQSVSARYGCIAAIEPENPYLLNATTQALTTIRTTSTSTSAKSSTSRPPARSASRARAASSP